MFIPKGPNNNIPALHHPGGLASTSRQTNIWINDDYLTDAYIHHSASMSELQFDIAGLYSQVYNLILQRFEIPFIRDYKN